MPITAKRAPSRRLSHPTRGEQAQATGNQSFPRKDKNMFDLSKLEVKETSTIHLEGPDGELLFAEDGEKVTVTVYGPGSKQFQKAQGARNRAVLELMRKGSKKVRDEDQRSIDSEFLCTCTASFNSMSYEGLVGHELTKAIYNNPKLGFIAEQVNRQINDWSNFTQGSDKT